MTNTRKSKPAPWLDTPAGRKHTAEKLVAKEQRLRQRQKDARARRLGKAALQRRNPVRTARKRVAGRSEAMAAKMREYKRLRAEFLAPLGSRRACAACFEPYGTGFSVAATEVHHVRGRAGTLLLDTRYWLPVCSGCHRRIHDQPKWARANGYLAARGEWGKQN